MRHTIPFVAVMTKRNLSLGAAALFILPLVGVLLFSGCETESVTQTDIQVEPNYVGLPVGQSVTLTASGWNNYRWELGNEEIGLLSARTGRRVVYTAIRGRGNTQIVTATADAVETPVVEILPDLDGTNAPAARSSVPETSVRLHGSARIIHQ